MSRALRLHESHTKPELVAKLEELRADPTVRATDGIYLLTPKAQRLFDDLMLAIYWHDRPKGNTHMRAAKPEAKWW